MVSSKLANKVGNLYAISFHMITSIVCFVDIMHH